MKKSVSVLIMAILAVVVACQPMGQATVDAMDAEGTLLDHATRPSLDLRGARAGNVGVFAGEFLPVEMAHAIGTGQLAVAAADALVVVHHDQAVIAVIGGSDRANLHAARALQEYRNEHKTMPARVVRSRPEFG